MSDGHVITAALHIPDLTPFERVVLIRLCDHFNRETGVCRPSAALMAGDAGMSRATVFRTLLALEAKRLIQRSKRRQNGVQATNEYELLFEPTFRMKTASHSEIDRVSESDAAESQRATQQSLTERHEPKELEPKELEPSTSLRSVERARERTSKPPRSRIVPDVWSPAAETFRVLQSEGYLIGHLERELARMRDHEFRDPKTDWDRTFRKWIRRDPPNKGPEHDRTHPPTERRAQREANLQRSFAAGMAVVGRR